MSYAILATEVAKATEVANYVGHFDIDVIK